MRKLLIIAALLFAPCAQAFDAQKYGLQEVGSANLSMLFWDVYDIKLFAQNGKYNPAGQYALLLKYNMSLDGIDIAERSAKEMRQQGSATELQLATWFTQMSKIFPDVKDGDVLTGIKNAESATIFIFNDEEIGRISDAEFTSAFFDIWLSEKTTELALRKKLLSGL